MNIFFTPFIGFETFHAFSSLSRRDSDIVLSVLSMSDYKQSDGKFISVDKQKEDLSYLAEFYRVHKEITFWGRESLSLTQEQIDKEIEETIRFHRPDTVFYPDHINEFPGRRNCFKNDIKYKISNVATSIRYCVNRSNMQVSLSPRMVNLKKNVIKSVYSLDNNSVIFDFVSSISNLGENNYKERFFVDNVVFNFE